MAQAEIVVFDSSDQQKHRVGASFDGEWTVESLNELCGFMAQRLGAAVGLLPAQIELASNGRVRITIKTERERAVSGPLQIPPDVLTLTGWPVGREFPLEVRAPKRLGVEMLDLHLPVMSGQWKKGGGFAAAVPVVYGTAFPIAHGGIFVTAAHVIRDAKSDGEPVLSRLRSGDGAMQAYQIVDMELFEGLDLAVMRCPALEAAIPLSLDFDRELTIFDEVSAVGYPFSVDAEHLTMVHRGFAGHIVTRREFYHLPMQPPGYELSFLTPPGMSGAPLVAKQGGSHYCYGYIIQQSSVSVKDVTVALGLAVSIEVLLWIRSAVVGKPLAFVLGREPVEPRPPEPPVRPGGLAAPVVGVDGWPDD